MKCSQCLCLLTLLWGVRGENPQWAWVLGRCGVVRSAGRWSFSSSEALGSVCRFQTDPELEAGCFWVSWTLRCAEPHSYKKLEEGESFGACSEGSKTWAKCGPTYPGESPTASDQNMLCLIKSRMFFCLPHILFSVAVMLGARQRRERSFLLFFFYCPLFSGWRLYTLLHLAATLILLWLQTLTLLFNKYKKVSLFYLMVFAWNWIFVSYWYHEFCFPFSCICLPFFRILLFFPQET